MYSCVWVIGANSDLAKEIVKMLCNNNMAHKFYLGSRNIESMNTFIASIGKRELFSIERLDLLHFDSIITFINRCAKPDLVILAAGYLYRESPISADELTKVVYANFVGKVFFLECAQSKLRESGKCKVICIKSTAGEMGDGHNRFYAASKAAMKVYMQSFSFANHRYGIQTYIVRPGDMITKMKPIGGHWAISPNAAAETIIKQAERTAKPNGTIIYVPWFMKYVLLVAKIKRTIYDFRHYCPK